MPGPLLYAHRGASAEFPENTLSSFRRALEHGADALEMDCHMTSDGVIVVTHDPSGQRMCGVNREFRRSTAQQVQTWDAGHGFVSATGQRAFAGAGYQVPTFEQVLEALPEIPINLDLKQREPSMVEPMLELLRRTGSGHRVTLASFHSATMRAVRRAGYTGPTALAQREVIELLAVPRLLRRLCPVRGTAAQLPTHVGPIRLDRPRLLRKFRALGLRVDYWTINDPAEAERLLNLGADGIMTDDPATIGPVIRRWRERCDDQR